MQKRYWVGRRKDELGDLKWGDEMNAILVYAAFWLKQHKIPFEWGFLQTFCLWRHCCKFATKDSHLLQLRYQWPRNSKPAYKLFCSLPNIRLEDWYPGKKRSDTMLLWVESANYLYPAIWLSRIMIYHVTITHTFPELYSLNSETFFALNKCDEHDMKRIHSSAQELAGNMT